MTLRITPVLILLAMLLSSCGSDSGGGKSNLLLSDQFLNIAHRGGRLLAPEETLVTMRNADSIGVDVLEMDVNGSLDGVVVLNHDVTLERTTNGEGRVSEKTWEELSQLDAGYHFTRDGGATYPYRGQGVRMARLEEVLDEFPDYYYTIEIKQAEPPIHQEVMSLIEERGMLDQVVMASFSDDVVKAIRTEYPDVLTSLSLGEIVEFLFLEPDQEADYVPPGLILQVPPTQGDIVVISEEFLERARRFGMMVQAWTINDRDEMEWLIDLGVDGIMTDDPQLLEEVIIERGLNP